MIFQNRHEAGRLLARKLESYRDSSAIVLGLPRGGVTVAFEVAEALEAPLDVWMTRKLGVPFQPELGMGAIAEGGETYIDERLVHLVGATPEDVDEVLQMESTELSRRIRRYRRGRAGPGVRDRVVIVIDDGIATGATMRAVLRAIRKRAPKRLVLATPVASASTLDALREEADDVLCLSPEPYLGAIGEFYVDFTQVTDEEVVDLLDRAAKHSISSRAVRAAPRSDRPIQITVDGATLQGVLWVPRPASGIVVFAHGSGSSRHSVRNRYVAEELYGAGFATLLFDLLTMEEAAEDDVSRELRFDVALLATRLCGVVDWVDSQRELQPYNLGIFGASTGAAAALITAADRPDAVRAVFSRGGRPDLADEALDRVRASTRLVVGSLDTEVLRLNELAFARLLCPKDLAIVPGASHLFQEPGTLEQVAELAVEWFRRQLIPHRLAATG